MGKEEAASFLRIAAFRELPNGETSDELQALCARFSSLVDHLPLAVHLAAATIEGSPEILRLDSKITVQDACLAVARHIERFNENMDLILMRNDHKFMQSPYPLTLLTTFETTFANLEQDTFNGPSILLAMSLLRLLAFLNDDGVVQLHERFRMAYKGVFSDLREFASCYLSQWHSKLLTGHRSLASCRERREWDDYEFCETLNLLQRHGLVSPEAEGSRQLMPLHKIVRWRMHKEAEPQMREYLFEYSVILQLAMRSTWVYPDQTLRISDELADVYHKLGQSQDAEKCARLHLEKQIELYGRPNDTTIRSLGRLIEILCHQDKQDQVAREVFAFVEDINERAAILEMLPANLLISFQSVFSQHDPSAVSQKPQPALLDGSQSPGESLVVPLPLVLVRNKQPVPPSAKKVGEQVTLFDPGRKTKLIREQIEQQIASKKQALEAMSDRKPNLLALFEVLALGSSALFSRYMRYIDSETVQYRDPDCGRTVLHFAAAYGQRTDVKLCNQSGSDVEAEDRYCATPIRIASLHGRRHVFPALIGPGPQNLTKDGPTTIPRVHDGFQPLASTLRRSSDGLTLDIPQQDPKHSGAINVPRLVTPKLYVCPDEITTKRQSHQPYVEEYESEPGDQALAPSDASTSAVFHNQSNGENKKSISRHSGSSPATHSLSETRTNFTSTNRPSVEKWLSEQPHTWTNNAAWISSAEPTGHVRRKSDQSEADVHSEPLSRDRSKTGSSFQRSANGGSGLLAIPTVRYHNTSLPNLRSELPAISVNGQDRHRTSPIEVKEALKPVALGKDPKTHTKPPIPNIASSSAVGDDESDECESRATKARGTSSSQRMSHSLDLPRATIMGPPAGSSKASSGPSGLAASNQQSLCYVRNPTLDADLRACNHSCSEDSSTPAPPRTRKRRHRHHRHHGHSHSRSEYQSSSSHSVSTPGFRQSVPDELRGIQKDPWQREI